MKNLIASLAITLCCLLGQASYAQNIEGQIVASQFGTFQVPGLSTGSLQFDPASCMVFGGGKNFASFTTGVPLKIVDSNPNLNEIDTPVAVFISSCSISMTTQHIHATPFYVTSGTGGLQEALLNGVNKQGGANTVILDADWYTQVSPGNPATVIAAAKGNTSLGLVDVTTVPYTYYQWSGSQYTVVASGGGNLPGGTGIVKVTSGMGGLATAGTDYLAPGALPSSTTATTQSAGDNTTKVATDAFVIANSATASIPATSAMLKGSGAAGIATTATAGTDYVAPNGNISGTAANLSGTPALPSGTSATTQTVGDNTTNLATDAFVLANAGTATIPGTTLVLKGTGTPGISVAATPGTDYLGTAAIPATLGMLKGSNVAGAAAVASPGADYIAPGTPCGGALAGTFPNCTIVGTTISPKVINGKSYSALYPQGDIAQRINACIVDAETRANGNTTGICSSEGEAGLAAGVTTHNPFVIGDVAGDAVEWELPPVCTFNFFGGNFTGTQVGITQYSNTVIYSPSAPGTCKFVNNTGSNNQMFALYEAQSGTSIAAGTYMKLDGISFQNGSFSVPVTTASAQDVIVQFMTDNSQFKNFQINDYGTGQIPLQIGGTRGSGTSAGSPCCATAFENLNINGQYAATGLVQISASSANGAAELVSFRDVSFDHPVPGGYVISCQDTTSAHLVHVQFEHLYSEIQWNSSGDVAPAFYDGSSGTSSACGLISVIDQEVKNEGTFTAPVSSPIWRLAGTFAAGFQMQGFSMPFNVTQPVQAVANLMTGSLGPASGVTDASGVLGLYSTENAQVPGGTTYAGTATGAVNVLAVTLPGTSTLAGIRGLPLSFTANLATTSTTPTLNVNGLGAITIIKGTVTALASGDITTTSPPVVIYNGTNFILLNPVITAQTGSSGAFNANGAFTSSSGLYLATSNTTNTTFTGGENGSSASTLGTAILQGGNNTGAGASGDSIVRAGASSGGGNQGKAYVEQSFTVATALSATFETVSMTTTADQVQAAPLGAINLLGVAQTVGGTNTQIYVVSHGKTTTRFDGTPVVGDVACSPPASTGTAGLAHDNGSAACPPGQGLGVITGQVSGSGSGATATVELFVGPTNPIQGAGPGLITFGAWSAAGTPLSACGSTNVNSMAAVLDASSLTPGTTYSVSAGAGSDKVFVQCAYNGSTYAWQTM